MSTGWQCPVCNRGVAPSEKTCDHGGQVDAVSIQTAWPHYNQPPSVTVPVRLHVTTGDPVPRYGGWGGVPGGIGYAGSA